MATSNIRSASTVEPQVLLGQKIATTSSTSVYVCPANSSVKVVTATVCNSSATTSTAAYLSVKKSGDSTPWRVANINLRPLESTTVPELIGLLLGPGDAIAAAAADTTNVELVVSGVVSS